MWKIRVQTKDGKVEEFTALGTYELTEEQKLLWRNSMNEKNMITAMRITSLSEMKVKDEENSRIGHAIDL